MGLYGQDAETRLLSTLIKHLALKSMIDVGAEQGGLADELLRAGVEELHALDPHPDNVRALRTRFGSDERVNVYGYAVSDNDGRGSLHVSRSPGGEQLAFGHTLLDRPDTAEIVWRETIQVTRRSLDSLIESREIPKRVGILKVDTEGHDLAVVLGMGPLEPDLVMVEHWTDLPRGLGTCPWTAREMVAALQPRGFAHFAFIVHRGEFVILKWDDADVERGAMGNLLFLHERVLERLLPDLLDCAGSLAEQAVRIGEMYAGAANDRLELIEKLTETADTRAQALEATTAKLNSQADELTELRRRRSA